MVQHVGEDTLELEVDSLGYIDHADQLSDETMRLMKEKQIFAVPTFTIFEYFADHAAAPEQGPREHQMLEVKAQEFKKHIAAGVPMAVGSDVGPFPHGTQAREVAEEAFHYVQPRRAGESEVQMKARMPRQPALHFGVA